jgi:tripartite-type tricarboxylate transporter receptor subunit TctC
MRQLLVGLASGVAALVVAIAGPVQATDYPQKPVRILVPYPPGGVVDVLARIIAQELSEGLGGRFHVENLGPHGRRPPRRTAARSCSPPPIS